MSPPHEHSVSLNRVVLCLISLILIEYPMNVIQIQLYMRATHLGTFPLNHGRASFWVKTLSVIRLAVITDSEVFHQSYKNNLEYRVMFNLLNPIPLPPGGKTHNLQETASEGFLILNKLWMFHIHVTGRNSANWSFFWSIFFVKRRLHSNSLITPLLLIVTAHPTYQLALWEYTESIGIYIITPW